MKLKLQTCIIESLPCIQANECAITDGYHLKDMMVHLN